MNLIDLDPKIFSFFTICAVSAQEPACHKNTLIIAPLHITVLLLEKCENYLINQDQKLIM